MKVANRVRLTRWWQPIDNADKKYMLNILQRFKTIIVTYFVLLISGMFTLNSYKCDVNSQSIQCSQSLNTNKRNQNNVSFLSHEMLFQ